jgi:DNA-binding HxlR family transcriptional regulator
MRWSEIKDEHCSIARALAVVGDRWTMLVLRDAFLGVRRFDDFQQRLGISRTLLRDRLAGLVADDVLRRERYQDRPPRDEYRLTARGLALHPVMLAIAHWGDSEFAGPEGPPLLRQHKTCGHDFAPVTTCSVCGDPVAPRDVEMHAGHVAASGA